MGIYGKDGNLGSYVNNSLIPNERVIYEGKFALMDNWFWIVISMGILLIPIYLFQKTNEIAVTNHRIIGKKGIIRRDTIDFAINSIEKVDVKQSVFGRIFGFGDVIIHGTGASVKKITALKNPEDFKQAINSAKYN